MSLTPRSDHYRAIFKQQKETSDLIKWLLDEFEQEEQQLAAARADLGLCVGALDDIRGEADSEKPDRYPEAQLTYIVNRAEEAISPYPAPTTPGPAEEASEEGRE